MRWVLLTEQEQEYIKQCINNVCNEFVVDNPEIKVYPYILSEFYLTDYRHELIITLKVPPTFKESSHIQTNLTLLRFGTVYIIRNYEKEQDEVKELVDLSFSLNLLNKEDMQEIVEKIDEELRFMEKQIENKKEEKEKYLQLMTENCAFPLSFNGPICK